MKQQPQVIDACHQCLVWLIPQLDKFPRNRRFTLGEKIENGLLNALSQTTEAYYSHQNKRNHLVSANKAMAVVQHLWRVAYELKVISQKSYQYGSQMFVGISKQLGAWQKSCTR